MYILMNLKKKEGTGGEEGGGVGGEGECDLYPECQNDGNSPVGIPPGQSAGKILENLAHRFRPFALLEICGVAQAHSGKLRVVFDSKFFNSGFGSGSRHKFLKNQKSNNIMIDIFYATEYVSF
jgi:hypothetical protein